MNDNHINDIVKSYQTALEKNNAVMQKKHFTGIYRLCKKMMWYIAWSVWKKCKFMKKKHECIDKDHQQRWTWKEFNYPLIHGLHIAAGRFDAARHTKFFSFAFQCIQRTLLNYCERMCPLKVQRRDEELQEHVTQTAATSLEKLIRDQEIEVIIKTIKKMYCKGSMELQIFILYMLGFIQKDIVFFLNTASAYKLTEPAVSNYIKQYIPQRLIESAAELRAFFSQPELKRFTLKKLRENDGFFNQFILKFASEIEQVRKEFFKMILKVKDTSIKYHNKGITKKKQLAAIVGDACHDNYFYTLIYNQKKLKSFMRIVKQAYRYQNNTINERVP